MVGWYDPRVLAHSAYQVAIANIFGRHSDTRLIEALASQPQNEFDYSARAGRFLVRLRRGHRRWLEFHLRRSRMPSRARARRSSSGSREDRRPAACWCSAATRSIPIRSRSEYDVRTETPYRMAFAGRAQPDVFAIPGNHDWYDSLVAFSRTFCRPERGFAGCPTRQTRSYFALKLPANWWLLAIDLQLGADLDEPQVQYFQKVAARMDDAARLIFCVPEPRWILEDAYPSHASYEELSSTRFLEEKVFKRKARVFLTGDLHFYKRHENAEGIQKITSGGGGAFLHPDACAGDAASCATDSSSAPRIPTRRLRGGLTWRNFLFPSINPKSGWLYAFLYAMSAWLASASLEAADVIDLPTALAAAMNAAIRDPLNGMWLVSVIGGFIFFTDTHIRSWRILGGAFHALLHLAAAFAVGWLALLLTVQGFDLAYGSIAQLLLSGLITFVLGGPVGAFILGVYLFVSIRVFGRHGNEAFSSLRIQDFKQWLRLRIDAAGGAHDLRDRASIGCRGAGARRNANGKPTIEADDARATAPRLIDKVEIRP